MGPLAATWAVKSFAEGIEEFAVTQKSLTGKKYLSGRLSDEPLPGRCALEQVYIFCWKAPGNIT